MKNLAITVPPAGASIQLVLRAGASGQAIIVASDEVEIHSTNLAPATTKPKPTLAASNGNTGKPKLVASDLDEILKRLIKLKPTRRLAAANSIKAMFQFDTPISDEAANQILERLRKRGSLTIDANNRLQFQAT